MERLRKEGCNYVCGRWNTPVDVLRHIRCTWFRRVAYNVLSNKRVLIELGLHLALSHRSQPRCVTC